MKSITFASLWVLACFLGFLPNNEGNQAVCSATGDPHYTTFDGKKYDFMGLCEYVLAKDTDNTFTVLVKNKPCGNSVTCTYAVRVKVKGLNIKMRREGRVQLSGQSIKLPYNSGRGVSIVKDGSNIRITTGIGLTIEYNLGYNVYVTVDDRYKGKTLGLCGTFNDDRKDDFKKPDNQLARNAQEFGISWKVNEHCHDTVVGSNPCETVLNGDHAQQAKMECDALKRNPFRKCNDKVKVASGFIQKCEYDVCACSDHPLSCLCEEYDDYVTSCSMAGINIMWRHLRQFKFCDSPCARDPCLNGGSCQHDGRSYKCFCRSGYMGSRCQNKKSPCAENPCLNGGTCQLDGKSYKCICHSGFMGSHCKIKESPCAKNPCQHGGTCQPDGKSYNCICRPGRMGSHCQRDR